MGWHIGVRNLGMGEPCSTKVLEAFVRGTFKQTVAKNKDMPLLLSISADGTPCRLKKSIVAHDLDEHVRRKGGDLVELLVLRGFVLCRPSDVGCRVQRAFLKGPIPMHLGKGAEQHFTSIVREIKTLQDMGAKSICITHYGFDGALFKPMRNLLHARHGRHHLDAEAADVPGVGIAKLADWQVYTQCCLHDASKGLEWALKPHAGSDDMKDLFIVVESLRNSYVQLYRNLTSWLCDHILLEDEPFDHEEACRWWTFLNLAPQTVEHLTAMNLRWDGSNLRVNRGQRCKDAGLVGDVLDEVRAVILKVWYFRRFTDGRWTSISNSSRSLIAALSLGLDSVVDKVRKDPQETDYFLHGYNRFSAKLRSAVFVAACAGWVTDELVSTLMDDDRVCGQVEELKSLMLDELMYIGRLPPSVFERMAGCIDDSDPGLLRKGALQAAAAAAALFWRQVLREAEQLPWSLAVGDIEQNLRELKSQDAAPRELTAQKIWKLAKAGWMPHLVAEGVQLLRFVSWSTAQVEQGHASAALLHRQHPEYEEDILCARAVLHMARNLLPEQREGRKREREDAATKRIQRKVPRRISGQSMLFKDIMQYHQAQGGGGPVSQADKVALMRAAHDQWHTLPSEAQADYKRKAVQLGEEREAQATEQLAVHLERVAFRRRRVENELAADQGPTRLGSCRFTQTDLEKMHRMMGSDHFDAPSIAAMRKKSLAPPPALEPTARARYAEVPPRIDEQACVHHWADLVCKHRESFQDCALFFLHPGGTQHVFALMYAKKSPRVSTWMRLEVCEEAPADGAKHLEDSPDDDLLADAD